MKIEKPPAMQSTLINIGEVSRRTGLTARAIRLYEALGIIGPPLRGESGYRRFSEDDVRTLNFVRRARRLGFDLDSIRRLVEFWRNGSETRSEVAKLLGERVSEIRLHEAEMRSSREILESILVDSVHDEAGCRLLRLLLDDDAASNDAAASPRSTSTDPA